MLNEEEQRIQYNLIKQIAEKLEIEVPQYARDIFENITIDGDTRTAEEWMRLYKIPKFTVRKLDNVAPVIITKVNNERRMLDEHGWKRPEDSAK